MAIERHDRDERQARLEWMLDEFEQARQRRLVKTGVSRLSGDPVTSS